MNNCGLLLAFCLLTFSLTAESQIRLIPLTKNEGQKSSHSNAHTSQGMTLHLPFWDDFSTKDPKPDSTYWMNSENIFINAGLANDPPSLYVASFDGLDQYGEPYGTSADEGPTDALTSVNIDISGNTPGDNLVLSFFYQLAGNGDLPEIKDSIRVDFLDEDSVWHAVWPSLAQELQIDGEFHQATIAVNDPKYFHDAFQFRFQAIGRQSGAFDIWNIDYVYLNKNRSLDETSFPDRTISKPPNAFLKNYYSMPYRHFDESNYTHSSFRIRNLITTSENPFKAYNYRFNYTIDVTDSFGVTTNFSHDYFVEPQESPIPINTSEEVFIRNAIADFGNIQDADSAHVQFELILETEDNKSIASGGDYDPAKFSPVNFRKNDTLKTDYFLTDYYAYDDGSAEVGAGLNYSGDKLAYKFELPVEQDYLTGLDLYFPFTGSDPDGKSIELVVWKDADGLPGAAAYKQIITVQRRPGKNNFVRYKFERPVLVSGTYFVGYRQITQGALAIGLDRNTNNSNKMYFNLDELWASNTLVKGSLMIRPVFEPVDPDLITGTDNLPDLEFRPFPNPVQEGVFYYEGPVDEIKLTDIMGRNIPLSVQDYSDHTHQMQVSQLASGIYLLHCLENNQWKVFRIRIQN